MTFHSVLAAVSAARAVTPCPAAARPGSPKICGKIILLQPQLEIEPNSQFPIEFVLCFALVTALPPPERSRRLD